MSDRVCADYLEAVSVTCDNCDWVGTVDQADPIQDFEDRLYPVVGGIALLPAGECPECGALAYFAQDLKDWPAYSGGPRLLKALEAILARIHGEWDHPSLELFGELSTHTIDDVERIAMEALG